MLKQPKASNEQLAETTSEMLARGDAVALQAAQRHVSLLAVKERSLKRLLKRLQSDKASQAKLDHWQERRATYVNAWAAADAALRLAGVRPHPLLPFESRPGAYGRIVDEYDKPWATQELRLTSAEGKALATARTDAEGYFSIWADEEFEGDVSLVAQWAQESVPLRRRGATPPPITSLQWIVPRGRKPPTKSAGAEPVPVKVEVSNPRAVDDKLTTKQKG